MIGMPGSHRETDVKENRRTWPGYSERVDIIREREYPLLKGPNSHKYLPSVSPLGLDLEIECDLGDGLPAFADTKSCVQIQHTLTMRAQLLMQSLSSALSHKK